jgi:hypothetical protein
LIDYEVFSGERGIRTPGPVTVNGFQDRRIRPLCHLSGAKIGMQGLLAKSSWILFERFSTVSQAFTIKKRPWKEALLLYYLHHALVHHSLIKMVFVL